MAWWRFWRDGKAEAEFRLRNAGPGRGFETSVKALVSVPGSMSLDAIVQRIARLDEVIPQYRARPASLRRKLAGTYEQALSGRQGKQAREAAEWLLEDAGRRAEEQLAALEARRAMFQAALQARTAAAVEARGA